MENKPGAAGAIGSDLVAKARPDGYTLLYATADTMSIGPAVKANLPYKVPDDFTFVARTLDFAYIIVVNPKGPIKSMSDLIAYAKANPGKLRYGTAGVGSVPHMATALIANAASIDLVHIPYGGVAPALTALMGGFVDFVVAAPSAKSYTDAGTLLAIATAGKERTPNFPGVPTLAESGLPNLIVTSWWGILAPAGTPEPVLARLRKEVAETMRDPKIHEGIRAAGFDPAYLDHDAFKDFVLKDLEQWKAVAKSANITVE